MKKNQINCRITYNNYVVIGTTKLDKIIFVKTYEKTSGRVFWFLGFDVERDLTKDVKRILRDDHKYPNSNFKNMFMDDHYQPEVSIIFDEATELIKASRKV